MQARRNGFGTTLLMIVPMLAVPVMAIFGIPQFAPVVASPPGPADELDHPLYAETRVGHSAVTPGRAIEVSKRQPLDLFRPYSAAGSDASTSQEDGAITQTQWTDPLQSVAAQSQKQTLPAPRPRADTTVREASVRSARQLPQQVYDVFSNDFDQQRTAQTTATAAAAQQQLAVQSQSTEPKRLQLEFPQLTWRQAVDRLNTLGATTYRLTPGLHPQEFRFVCFVTSVDDMRITRRFEAESVDPLVAVEKVLAQVENWRQ